LLKISCSLCRLLCFFAVLEEAILISLSSSPS
jgi:hypothetical protein